MNTTSLIVGVRICGWHLGNRRHCAPSVSSSPLRKQEGSSSLQVDLGEPVGQQVVVIVGGGNGPIVEEPPGLCRFLSLNAVVIADLLKKCLVMIKVLY